MITKQELRAMWENWKSLKGKQGILNLPHVINIIMRSKNCKSFLQELCKLIFRIKKPDFMLKLGF